MKTKLLLISPALLMFFFAAVVLPKPNDRLDVTAHERGTFTRGRRRHACAVVQLYRSARSAVLCV